MQKNQPFKFILFFLIINYLFLSLNNFIDYPMIFNISRSPKTYHNPKIDKIKKARNCGVRSVY